MGGVHPAGKRGVRTGQRGVCIRYLSRRHYLDSVLGSDSGSKPFRRYPRVLPMSLFFVVVVLLIFSPAACRAFLAHGRQEPAGNAGVGNRCRRGGRSRTNLAFVAPGTSTARGAESVARDAKPRYGCRQVHVVNKELRVCAPLSHALEYHKHHLCIMCR